MNILKPQKKLINNLRKIEELLDELEIYDEIKNILIENYKKENITIRDITIKEAIINNTEIMSSTLEKNTFIDVQFNNCNFSNTSFENCCFIRCEFNNCKLAGLNIDQVGCKSIVFVLDKCYNNNITNERRKYGRARA